MSKKRLFLQTAGRHKVHEQTYTHLSRQRLRIAYRKKIKAVGDG